MGYGTYTYTTCGLGWPHGIGGTGYPYAGAPHAS